MFLWLDILMAGILVWETASGYVYGVKTACVRILVLVGAVIVSLKSTANCSAYIQPVLAGRIGDALGAKVIAASTNQGKVIYLGLWQNVLSQTTGSDNAFYQSLMALIINVISFCFLFLVIFVFYRLLERRNNLASGFAGALFGFCGGLVAIMLILAVAPVLALAGRGDFLATAIEDSWLLRAFEPFIQNIVDIMARHIL